MRVRNLVLGVLASLGGACAGAHVVSGDEAPPVVIEPGSGLTPNGQNIFIEPQGGNDPLAVCFQFQGASYPCSGTSGSCGNNAAPAGHHGPCGEVIIYNNNPPQIVLFARTGYTGTYSSLVTCITQQECWGEWDAVSNQVVCVSSIVSFKSFISDWFVDHCDPCDINGGPGDPVVVTH
ncbi:hypothetical protein SH449x_003153 [Pirellulaceae bacterium SH449]